MEKDELTFNKRVAGLGPVVVGANALGDKICTDIEVGNNVSLETDDVTVLARITDIDGDKYKGEILGFENYSEGSYKGYVQGDIVDFEYDDIQGAIDSPQPFPLTRRSQLTPIQLCSIGAL